ncbi:MAG TPA: nuclear transport factor 2 family protein, partial [Longimicrobium sp.]|nr:nuclear transport factor 2 family protein [Longimicrobium sp.]
MRATILTIILVLAAAPTTSEAQESRPIQPTATQAFHDQGRTANRAAIEEFFSGLEAMDVQRAVGAFAEDGVQVMPYSPEGFPKRLDGRAAILRQYSGLPENYT